MRFQRLFILLFPAFILLNCNTTGDPAEPAPAAVIKLLSPSQGQTFKSTDTIKLIAECDYTKFSSGITFSVSLDSAKNWTLIKSLARKEGRTRDTLAWLAGSDLGTVPGGMGLLVKVEDYSKANSARSGYFFIAD